MAASTFSIKAEREARRAHLGGGDGKSRHLSCSTPLDLYVG
jgi:hypothetical protein